MARSRTSLASSEIPNSSYDDAGIGDITEETFDANPFRTFALPAPPAGEYGLEITGTGEGSYDLTIRAFDDNDGTTQVPLRNIPISTGEKQRYTFSYSPTPGVQFQMAGGFDGGGQRPRDVNKFLSYANPTDSHTKLPVGQTTFQLVVFYRATVIPETLTGTLNGADIRNLFSPSPNHSDVILLNFQPGSNVSKLSIDGSVGTRTATDSDRLVFSVQ